MSESARLFKFTQSITHDCREIYILPPFCPLFGVLSYPLKDLCGMSNLFLQTADTFLYEFSIRIGLLHEHSETSREISHD